MKLNFMSTNIDYISAILLNVFGNVFASFYYLFYDKNSSYLYYTKKFFLKQISPQRLASQHIRTIWRAKLIFLILLFTKLKSKSIYVLHYICVAFVYYMMWRILSHFDYALVFLNIIIYICKHSIHIVLHLTCF